MRATRSAGVIGSMRREVPVPVRMALALLNVTEFLGLARTPE
jgi:hypothetical protein